uniref:Ig-like domain-containing protein n=1 Tax=Monopterus albus TaxID=43700 RepID=A0A3Q3KBU1_MONAL
NSYSISSLIFETETVHIGDDVNLTCTRKGVGSLFWVRLASGNLPEVLGKSFSLETVHPRITTSKEPGTFVLRITKARLSDTAFYFCIKTQQQQSSIFLKGTALRVEGKFRQTLINSELDVTADPSPAPCHPGDSVTLQCSLLSDSENKTCSEENSVCCFRAGSHQSHQGFYHTHIFDEYKRNPEGFSRKKCVYSFFKNISSSDAGTCYCAVATCEEIFSGNGTKLDIEVVFLLCAALAVSQVVIAFLLYSIKKLKKQSCGSSHGKSSRSYFSQSNYIWQNYFYISPVFLFYNIADVALQTNAATRGNQESQQVKYRKKN